MVSFKDVEKALDRIKKYIHKTPLIYSGSFSKLTGAEVYIKAENLQKTGSFKVRGAFNKLSSLKGKVITASMGNHAQAVSYASTTLGLTARIVMPRNVPIVKAEATKGYGAEIVLYGESYREALDYAKSVRGYQFIHGFDDELIIAGQGTIGIEVARELNRIDTVLVPVGGGGLISGIALAIKALSPRTKVIGVQTSAVPSAYQALKTGEIVEVQPAHTIADGIAISRIGESNFMIMKKYVDDILTVNEDTIAMSILLFLERKKLVVEGAGAVPLSAVLENRGMFSKKRVVLIVSGGNIDFNLIDRIIYKGLVKSNRIGVIETIVDDIPGSLNRLSGVIAGQRGNILNVDHDRLSKNLPLGKTKITFTIEIRDKKHFNDIVRELKKHRIETRPLV